jgi:hypothetical protein
LRFSPLPPLSPLSFIYFRRWNFLCWIFGPFHLYCVCFLPPLLCFCFCFLGFWGLDG